jgi:hypothetical protein
MMTDAYSPGSPNFAARNRLIQAELAGFAAGTTRYDLTGVPPAPPPAPPQAPEPLDKIVLSQTGLGTADHQRLIQQGSPSVRVRVVLSEVMTYRIWSQLAPDGPWYVEAARRSASDEQRFRGQRFRLEVLDGVGTATMTIFDGS